MKVVFLVGYIFLFQIGLAQTDFKKNTIQNFSKSSFCININIIGNYNNVSSVTIPIEEITQAMQGVLASIAKNQLATADKLYKEVFSILAQIKNVTQPKLMIDQQSRSNDILDTLAEKYLRNTPGYGEVKKNIFINYKEIQPLVCNKEKVQITEINGIKYYLASNILITSNDITLYKTKGPLTRFKFKNKFGYLDGIGSIVVPPQYDTAADLSNNLAMVHKTGLYWAFIDSTGKESKRFTVDEFDKVHSFSDHFSLVKRKTTNDEPGYYFMNDRWEYKHGPYYYAESFSHGLALVTDLQNDPFFLKNIDKIAQSGFDVYVNLLKPVNPELSIKLKTGLELYRTFRRDWSSKKIDSCNRNSNIFPYCYFSNAWTYIDTLQVVTKALEEKGFVFSSFELPKSDVRSFLKDIYSFCKNAVPILSRKIMSGYINTAGSRIFSDSILMGRSFEYENMAIVCKLTYDQAGINFMFNLIDRNSELKKDFKLRSLQFRSYDLHGFPFSNFSNGLAVSEKQIIDSSGDMLTKLSDNFYFDGRFDNELFITYTQLPASNSAEKGTTSLYTPRTSYGLVNKYGVEVLPAVYKSIELISDVLCKVETFDNKVEFFHISANGKSIPIKTTQ